jgi:hypothetical protein
MSKNDKEIKVVMNFELCEIALNQTKYTKNELEELLIDLLEGRYKEKIFDDDIEILSPILNVYIGSIDDVDDVDDVDDQ